MTGKGNYVNLLGKNSWNHLRYIYFWRVLVIWNHLESVAGLASSFKDKVKIEKKHGTGENQPDQKKKVKVEEGGKIKSTGGKINKKTSQTATLVRKWLNCVFKLLKKKKKRAASNIHSKSISRITLESSVLWGKIT